MLRHLNYSILQGELEQEHALEDMHMFFVAFNKRTKKICSQVEVVPDPENEREHDQVVLLKETDLDL